MTRHDILTAVVILGSYVNNPQPYHVKGVKHVFRYLLGTLDETYNIVRDEKFHPWDISLLGFTDSSWGDDKVKRRSLLGYVTYLSFSPVTVSSK